MSLKSEMIVAEIKSLDEEIHKIRSIQFEEELRIKKAILNNLKSSEQNVSNLISSLENSEYRDEDGSANSIQSHQSIHTIKTQQFDKEQKVNLNIQYLNLIKTFVPTISDSSADVNQVSEELCLAWSASGKEDETLFLKIIRICLSKKIYKYFKSKRVQTLNEFIDILLQKFQDYVPSAAEILTKIEKTCQKRKETLSKFAERLQLLEEHYSDAISLEEHNQHIRSYLILKNCDLIMTTFVKGIRNIELRNIVNHKQTDRNLHDLLTTAIFHKERLDRQLKWNSELISLNKVKKKISNPNTMEKKIYLKNVQMEKSTSSVNILSLKCSYCKMTNHNVGTCFKRKRDKNICSICRIVGHFDAFCPSKNETITTSSNSSRSSLQMERISTNNSSSKITSAINGAAN